MSDRPTNHYFDASPDARESRRDFTVTAGAMNLVLSSSSGVFSSRGLDKGTAVFLEMIRRRPSSVPPDGSNLCDLGSGSGALALVLAATNPACTVHAVDVNERARRLCVENAERNGLTNVVVSAPDDVDPGVRFHVLWSNPPIRIGKSALHDLLGTWLSRLSPAGHADIVVAKNLGADSLTDWMTAHGHRVTRLGSSKGFRVLRISPRNAQ